MKKSLFVLGIASLGVCLSMGVFTVEAAVPVKKAPPVKKTVFVKKVAPKKIVKKAPAKPKTAVKKPAVKAQLAPTLYRLTSPTLAQFSVGEKLRGEPFTAVGTTEQVSGGDIAFDWALPEKMSMQPIKVDARTFKTESNGRDFMIRKFILKAEDAGNQHIVFSPKKISGLPKTVKEGDMLSFTIDGDLMIAGITKPAQFSGSAKVKKSGIVGSASTSVKRADYAISIPEVPFVASVDETVQLSINLSEKAH